MEIKGIWAMNYYSMTLEKTFMHFKGLVSSFLIDWLIDWLITPQVSFCLLSSLSTSELRSGNIIPTHPFLYEGTWSVSPGLGWNLFMVLSSQWWSSLHHKLLTITPYLLIYYYLLLLLTITKSPLAKLAKSPFIWYDFTFLVGISFRIVVLGLLLDQGDPLRMRLHQCD